MTITIGGDWRQDTKPCESCAITMRPRPGDKPSDWARRRTCGFHCGGVLSNRAKTFDLTCPFCGVRQKRRSERGKLRDTCGYRECHSAAVAARLTKPEAVYRFPEITGDLVADFSAHNLSFKPLPGSITRHEPERTLGGIGSAWMAG